MSELRKEKELIQQQKIEIERLKLHLSFLGNQIEKDKKYMNKQLEEIERYKKALEFYAFSSLSLMDDGSVAKVALRK